MKKVAVLRLDCIEEIPPSDVIGDVATWPASAPEASSLPPVHNRRRSLRPVAADPQLCGNYASTAQLVPQEQPATLPSLFGLDVAALMAMNVSLGNIWRFPIFIQFSYSGEMVAFHPLAARCH